MPKPKYRTKEQRITDLEEIITDLAVNNKFKLPPNTFKKLKHIGRTLGKELI